MPRTTERPKPPTQSDVAVDQVTIENPNQPDFANVQVPGGFAKVGEDNLNDATWSQSNPNIKGAAPAVSNVHDQLSALLGPDVIQKLIESGVAQALRDRGYGDKPTDNVPETHYAIPYYVAAHLVMYDDFSVYASLYNEFETKLARFAEAAPLARFGA